MPVENLQYSVIFFLLFFPRLFTNSIGNHDSNLRRFQLQSIHASVDSQNQHICKLNFMEYLVALLIVTKLLKK